MTPRPRSFFIDHSHYDPCRVCRGTYFRDEMVPASEVRVAGRLGVWKRGWVCRGCAFKTSGEEQQVLFHDAPEAIQQPVNPVPVYGLRERYERVKKDESST